MDIEIGDFLSIPAWNTIGRVVAIEDSRIGSDDSVTVTMETDPDGEHTSRFRLEPGEYENLYQ